MSDDDGLTMTPLERLRDAFDTAQALAFTANARMVAMPTGAWLYLADAIRGVLRERGEG